MNHETIWDSFKDGVCYIDEMFGHVSDEKLDELVQYCYSNLKKNGSRVRAAVATVSSAAANARSRLSALAQ